LTGLDARWRDPAPKAEYDAIIIGGGGHGLSTAYYLAKNHGLTNIAVLEKGYLGSGNIGRNTTIVRANYFLPGNSEFYSHSLKLWEGLEAELNYNVMHSQRGLINLFHSDGQRDAFVRRGNAMINQGDDAILLDREGCASICPISISSRRASRSMAACCTRAAARRGMMRWPGAMRAGPTARGGPDPELRGHGDRHRERPW
jgi:methylglutamate dehydrogenase subunit A